MVEAEETKSQSLKVVIAGDPGVGKTSLLKRFVEYPDNQANIVNDIYYKQFELPNGVIYRLELWDLPSSQAHYSTVIKQHFRKAVGALIVFDVSSIETFKQCTKWINVVKENAEPDCQIILVGNKTDTCLPNVVAPHAYRQIVPSRLSSEEALFSSHQTNGSKETKSKISSSDSKVEDSLSGSSARRESSEPQQTQNVDAQEFDRFQSNYNLIQLTCPQTPNQQSSRKELATANSEIEEENSNARFLNKNDANFQQMEFQQQIEMQSMQDHETSFESSSKKFEVCDQIEALSADFQSQTQLMSYMQSTSQSFDVFSQDMNKMIGPIKKTGYNDKSQFNKTDIGQTGIPLSDFQAEYSQDNQLDQVQPDLTPRQVSFQQAYELAVIHGLLYAEGSAKEPSNILIALKAHLKYILKNHKKLQVQGQPHHLLDAQIHTNKNSCI